jgi:hypothetical protein
MSLQFLATALRFILSVHASAPGQVSSIAQVLSSLHLVHVSRDLFLSCRIPFLCDLAIVRGKAGVIIGRDTNEIFLIFEVSSTLEVALTVRKDEPETIPTWLASWVLDCI